MQLTLDSQSAQPPDEAIRLETGAFRLLSTEQMEPVRVRAHRALVDERARPLIPDSRYRTWRAVDRMRWWNSSLTFPAIPNEYLHYKALQDWVFGFVITSVMLLAPGAGAIFLMRWQREVGSLKSVLSMAISLVTLFLLLLVMQRLAYPMWGKPGDPALWLRRVFLLSLPTPVFATLFTQVKHSEAVVQVGLWAELGACGVLVVLMVWFFKLYFDYAQCREPIRWIENETPLQALTTYYTLLRPSQEERAVKYRGFAHAAQYLAGFRLAHLLPGSEDQDIPARWRDPATNEENTLSGWAAEVARFSRTLEVAQVDQTHVVAGAIILTPVESGAKPRRVLGVCAIDVGGMAVEGREAAEVRQRIYRANYLTRFDDGWFVEFHPASTLSASDLRLVQPLFRVAH